MKHIKGKIFSGLMVITLLISFVTVGVNKSSAASTAYVQIVGSSKILFSGNITPGGCSVTDESNVVHTYTTALAICALDTASKQGGFTYKAKDFGGSLGLFVDAIESDTTPSDFSKYWSYNYNGQQAQNGVSNQTVQAGDVLSFQYFDPSINVTQQSATWGINYLKSQQTKNGDIQGFSGVNAWASMAFSSAGIDPSTVTNGGTSLLDYLKNTPPASNAPATDFEKAILAITASGQNPFNFGGVNYESKLESFDNNSQIGLPTQVNDDVFGLLALIASGPSASGSVKQDALNFIIKNEQSDGGFSWSTTGSSDVDDTAAAIQALEAAQNNGMTATGLSDAISKAKTFMLNNQKSDGSFVSSSTDTAGNTASTSWAAMALHALGMDTSTQMKNALSFIRGNQQANDSFAWQNSSTGETFTTSYAIPALEEKSWPIGIFNGSVSVTPSPTETVTPTPTITITMSPSPTPSETITPTGTVSPSPTPTEIVTPSPSPTPTLTATETPTVTPTPTETVTLTPTPSGQNSKLGGLNLDGYCASIGEGSQAVTHDQTWSCGNGSDAINMTSACQWQYNMKNVTAQQDIANNAYSWSCSTTSSSITPSPTVTVTPTVIQSDLKHKRKEAEKLIKDTQKQIHTNLKELNKHNRAIYQQIQDLIKNLTKKLRTLFG